MLARPTGHRRCPRRTKTMKWILFAAALLAGAAHAQQQEKAIFAAGCFWCTEEAFEKVPGVVSAVSGYIGGEKEKPTHQAGLLGIDGACRGGAGHVRSVESELRKAARHLLAQPRSHGHRPPVLRRRLP